MLLRSPFPVPTAVLASFLLLTSVAAQIPLSGAQSGVLPAGVYHTTGTLTIAAGQTWTLSPGVIVKFSGGGDELTVNGRLVTNGTAGNPVIFTGIQDDSAGGDTNGNGPSAATATAWRGIVFNGNATPSTLVWADVRYGGAGYVSNIHLNAASPTLTNCTIRNNYTHGMNCSANSFPTVSGCTFTSNGGDAIGNVPAMALAGFTSNSATGNGVNCLRVTVGTVSGALAIGPLQMVTGAVVFDTTLTVAAGASLTIAAGTNLKFVSGGQELTVNGTLVTNGTVGSPVVFTGIQDDSAGGDTNSNGASAATATAWRGIVFNATSSNCTLTRADVRFGGAGYVSNIHLNAASPTLTNCTIRNNYTHGINCSGNSFPTVSGCTFTSNGGDAIGNVPAMALPGFTGNSATGNAVNCLRVTVGAVNGVLAIGPLQMVTGAVVCDTTLTVAAGASLTIGAGTNLKFVNGGHELTVNGTLVTNGTLGSPVVFTGIQDDSAGGDTNSNGASAAGATAWRGIVFNATSSNCSLTGADVRYGGAGYISNIHLNAASPTLTNCTIRNNYTHGMNCSGNSAPVVTECTFTQNGGYAVAGLRLQDVPGFTNNHASGNAGNYLEVVAANVAGVLAIGSESAMQGALVLRTGLTVTATGQLTLRQGLVCKFDGAHEVNVSGSLRTLGTGYEPVVFTAFGDDAFGGDTNNNGPSNGGAASWRGVVVGAAATAGALEHTRIRWTGSGYVAGLTCNSPNVALRSVRVDGAFDRGFVLGDCAPSADNLVAWQCGGIGVHLTGGDHHIRHATVTGCGTGMRREPAWSGSVVNSISRGNGTNFANFGTGSQVLVSNGGFAGSNGNLDVDPQFVAAASGNLQLQPGSPCLGAADLLNAFVVGEDHDQNSRVLDHALTGAAVPDMGAYELGAWTMSVVGEARPGQALFYTLNGPPGDSLWAVGFLDGTLPVVPYGMLLVGASPGQSVLLLLPFSVPVGTPMLLAVPNDDDLIGLRVGLQTLTFAAGNPAVGNLTRMHVPLVRP